MPLGRSAGSEAKAVSGAITSMRIDDLIFHLASGIAEGQGKLDDVCMKIAAFMGEPRIAFGKNPRTDKPDLVSLLELGFSPNFYQFVDSILEVKVAISSQYEETYEKSTSKTDAYKEAKEANKQYGNTSKLKSETTGNAGIFNSIFGGSTTNSASNFSSYNKSNITEKSTRLNVTTIDAKYSSTYNFSVEGSSSIKTKIVPIPPPQLLEERIRSMIKDLKEEEERIENLYGIKTKLHLIINGARTLGGKQVFGNVGEPVLNDAKNDILKINEDALTKVNITDNSAELKKEIDYISQDHAGITDAHWAVVGNLVARQYADQYIPRLVSNAEIIASFNNDGDLVAVKAVIASVKKDLKVYGEHIMAILTALPLTPEEETEKAKAAGEGKPS